MDGTPQSILEQVKVEKNSSSTSETDRFYNNLRYNTLYLLWNPRCHFGQQVKKDVPQATIGMAEDKLPGINFPSPLRGAILHEAMQKGAADTLSQELVQEVCQYTLQRFAQRLILPNLGQSGRFGRTGKIATMGKPAVSVISSNSLQRLCDRCF